MINPLILLLKVVLIYLGGDLISGVFHWVEDTYLTDKCKIGFFRQVAILNDRHHQDPQDFTRCSYLANLRTSSPFYLMSLCVLAFFPSIQLFLLFTWSFLANLIHRMCHETHPPKLITFLQSFGLLQSPQHHRTHHYNEQGVTEKKEPLKYYCVMSNFLNPCLEYINFWRRLEKLIYICTGIKPIHPLE